MINKYPIILIGLASSLWTASYRKCRGHCVAKGSRVYEIFFGYCQCF